MFEILLGNRLLEKEQILVLKVNAAAAETVTFSVTRLDAEITFQDGTINKISGDAATKYTMSIPAGAGVISIGLRKRTGAGEAKIAFADTTNTRVTDVVDWSSLDPDITMGFFGCRNLTVVPETAPNCARLNNMFQKCTNFNSPAVVGWKTSHFTDLTSMFVECVNFNQPIGGWDVSNVTNTASMFLACAAFNQPLGAWITSRFSGIASMFNGCTEFNQNLNTWDTSNVQVANGVFLGCVKYNQPMSNWVVSKMVNISSMFDGCIIFNQDISGWKTTNVTNMSSLFRGAVAFNKTIAMWPVSKVTDLSYMFYSATAFNQNLSSMYFKTSANRSKYDDLATSWLPNWRPQFTG